MLLVSLLCGLSAGGCMLGQPVEPLFATVGSSYFCGRIQFIITSPTTVTPDWPDRPCSGNPPLAILDAGSMGWDEANARTLTMPLRIVNRGTESVQLPIRLILAVNGKTVLNPFETLNSTMIPLNADSTRTDGTKVWLVGGSGTVGPSDSTVIKTVLFQINSPVIQGRFAFTISGETVDQFPVVPPDSNPSWFDHDSSYYFSGKGPLRRVVSVRFDPSALANERQAAIDSVGGVVIGGARFSTSDGFYSVLVPTATTLAALDTAIATLKRQPKVDMATYLTKSRPLHLRPNDGAGWTRDDWALRPGQSGGDNQWLEEISAPLAWGCATGTASTAIGVIDRGFDSTDVSANVVTMVPRVLDDTLADGRANWHGYHVAQLLGAAGNNDYRTTGVVWRSGLRLLDSYVGQTAQMTAIRIKRLADSGVRIINLSYGIETASGNPTIDSLFADGEGEHIRRVMKILSPAQRPLLVVAAGNLARNAAMMSPANVAIDPLLRPYVIVVGASALPQSVDLGTRTAASYSNHGGLVDVFAPGNGPLVNPNGVIEADSGTSFAAPLVTGIAGLLSAFDPTLTATDIRSLIVEGADSGDVAVEGTGVGANKHLANAYESLKAAARRQSAPLCGNRVWTENLNSIKVRRGNTVQSLYTSPDTIGVLLLHHGGRRIHFQTSGSAGIHRSLDYAVGGWEFSPGSSGFPDSLSGTTWSLFRRTHDADSAAGPPHFNFYGANTSRPTGTFAITLGTSASSGRTLSFGQRALALPGNFISTRRDAEVDTTTGAFLGYVEQTGPQFQSPTNTYQQMNIVPVPSPLNDRVYFAINVYSSPVTSITQWAPGANATPIGNEWSYQERQVKRNYLSQDTELWSVPWAGGTAQMHWGRGGKTITWFGLAEFAGAAGHEAVMAIGTIDAAAAGLFVGGFVQCNIEYMLIAQQTPTEPPRSAPPTTCDIGGIETAQIAPRVVGPGGFQPILPLIPGLR